jgi:hypothetical protein
MLKPLAGMKHIMPYAVKIERVINTLIGLGLGYK